jgi:aryl-alcohol dehydrogenase-like predicted oxidoreductase
MKLSRSTLLRGTLGLALATSAGRWPRAIAQTAEAPMQTRPIPSTGKPLPVIGCGTWQTFDVGNDAAQRAVRAQVLQTLFDAGGSVIDSSPMYGSSEEVAGAAIAAIDGRDHAFIATKVWTRGRDAGIEQMRRSMALLRADPIDLMQVHNLVDWRTQLPTLRAWKAEGHVRCIGLTHYTASADDELERVLRAEPVDFVQLNYAINDRTAEERLLPLAVDQGIAVIVNQPFGGGGLLRSLGGKPLPGWAGEIGCSSWAQLLLKFTLAHRAVTCVIPGTGKVEHMRDNVQAGRGELPERAFWAPRLAALGF